MIKRIDIIGALIVLSSYFFLAPVSFLSFFAITPFLVGVAVSKHGLASHANKRWATLYLLLALGLLVGVLLFLWIILPVIIIAIYIIPALVASSSLTMAYFTKNGTAKTIKRQGTS